MFAVWRDFVYTELLCLPADHQAIQKKKNMQTPSWKDLSEVQDTEQILIVNMLFYPTLYSILCLALTTWCLHFGQVFNKS